MRTTRTRLRIIEELLSKLEVILLVRDPGATMAAEAFEGLRRQVAMAAQDRQTHLAHLSELDASIAKGADIDGLKKVLSGMMSRAGLDRVADEDAIGSGPAGLFAIEETAGPRVEVIAPAYVDRQTGAIVRQGIARRPVAVTVSVSDGLEPGGDLTEEEVAKP